MCVNLVKPIKSILIRRDPTSLYKEKLNLVVSEAVSIGISTVSEANKMLPLQPVVPTFHHFPRTHKTDVSPLSRVLVLWLNHLET